MNRRSLGRSLSLIGMLAVGCIGSPQREPANETTPKAASSPTPRPSEAASKAATARPRPHFVAPAEGAVDEVVRQALSSAQADGQRLVVYVGATWCEPCEAFHHAVERGELDEPLAGVRFLDFDSDRDGARLTEAGYDGRYIPRFVLPAADGRGSARRIEGGIKGEGAVAHILGRLSPLLAGS